MVTSSVARMGSSTDQDFVQEQATTLGDVPYGWTRVKLEPDCYSCRLHIINIEFYYKNMIRCRLDVRRVENQKRLFLAITT
jgi:hypothetical protein